MMAFSLEMAKNAVTCLGLSFLIRREASVEDKAKLIEETIVYFEEPGQQNTKATLNLALARAKARGIKKVVLASARGTTARAAARLFADTDIKMVVIPHQYGLMPEEQAFPNELIAELKQKGHCVYFSTMLFHTDDLYGSRIPSALAMILRTFCQGMKVVHEILLMATNGGCVADGEMVIVVTGTGRGADTAVVAIAAPSTRLYDLHITEIICKPLQSQSWSLTGKPTPVPSEIRKIDMETPGN
jgi:uncharacterized protein